MAMLSPLLFQKLFVFKGICAKIKAHYMLGY